jgi:hypothetical protein
MDFRIFALVREVSTILLTRALQRKAMTATFEREAN